MEDLRADITNFLVAIISTLLGFFNGTDSELTEDQIAGIKNFVDLIFIL